MNTKQVIAASAKKDDLDAAWRSQYVDGGASWKVTTTTGLSSANSRAVSQGGGPFSQQQNSSTTGGGTAGAAGQLLLDRFLHHQEKVFTTGKEHRDTNRTKVSVSQWVSSRKINVIPKRNCYKDAQWYWLYLKSYVVQQDLISGYIPKRIINTSKPLFQTLKKKGTAPPVPAPVPAEGTDHSSPEALLADMMLYKHELQDFYRTEWEPARKETAEDPMIANMQRAAKVSLDSRTPYTTNVSPLFFEKARQVLTETEQAVKSAVLQKEERQKQKGINLALEADASGENEEDEDDDDNEEHNYPKKRKQHLGRQSTLNDGRAPVVETIRSMVRELEEGERVPIRLREELEGEEKRHRMASYGERVRVGLTQGYTPSFKHSTHEILQAEMLNRSRSGKKEASKWDHLSQSPFSMRDERRGKGGRTGGRPVTPSSVNETAGHAGVTYSPISGKSPDLVEKTSRPRSRGTNTSGGPGGDLHPLVGRSAASTRPSTADVKPLMSPSRITSLVAPRQGTGAPTLDTTRNEVAVSSKASSSAVADWSFNDIDNLSQLTGIEPRSLVPTGVTNNVHGSGQSEADERRHTNTPRSSPSLTRGVSSLMTMKRATSAAGVTASVVNRGRDGTTESTTKLNTATSFRRGHPRGVVPSSLAASKYILKPNPGSAIIGTSEFKKVTAKSTNYAFNDGPSSSSPWDSVFEDNDTTSADAIAFGQQLLNEQDHSVDEYRQLLKTIEKSKTYREPTHIKLNNNKITFLPGGKDQSQLELLPLIVACRFSSELRRAVREGVSSGETSVFSGGSKRSSTGNSGSHARSQDQSSVFQKLVNFQQQSSSQSNSPQKSSAAAVNSLQQSSTSSSNAKLAPANLTLLLKPYLSFVSTLDLSENKLSALPVNFGNWFPSLRALHLHGNSIGSFTIIFRLVGLSQDLISVPLPKAVTSGLVVGKKGAAARKAKRDLEYHKEMWRRDKSHAKRKEVRFAPASSIFLDESKSPRMRATLQLLTLHGNPLEASSLDRSWYKANVLMAFPLLHSLDNVQILPETDLPECGFLPNQVEEILQSREAVKKSLE